MPTTSNNTVATQKPQVLIVACFVPPLLDIRQGFLAYFGRRVCQTLEVCCHQHPRHHVSIVSMCLEYICATSQTLAAQCLVAMQSKHCSKSYAATSAAAIVGHSFQRFHWRLKPLDHIVLLTRLLGALSVQDVPCCRAMRTLCLLGNYIPSQV